MNNIIKARYNRVFLISENCCTIGWNVYVCFTFQTHKCTEYKMIQPVIMEDLSERRGQAVAAS